MPLNRQSAVQAAVVADRHPHVMRILNGGKIKMFAPNKGDQRFQKPCPRRQIAAAGPGLDKGRALPCAALRLIIAFCSGHRQTNRGHRRVGTQTQINPKHITVRRHI